MTLTRRKTLAVLGGGLILAAGAGGYTLSRTPTAAVEPWKRAGQYADPRMAALSFAILAPNPHNRQPWSVDLSTKDAVTLYVDTTRLLPHTDPFSRQIVVGLGCFLETLVLGAAARGFAVDLDIFPDGEDARRLDARRVAVARFRKGGVAEPELFDQVLHRRSVKEPYDMDRPVTRAALDRLVQSAARGSYVTATGDTEEVAWLREVTTEALRKEIETPHTYKESVDLFRIGHREVNASPDGIDFSGPFFEFAHLTGQFTRNKALDTGSMSYSSGYDMVLGAARTGMAYVWQVTQANTRSDQINAGRDWMRLHLAATALGVAVQPMSQALQEYAEVAPYYKAVHEKLAPEGGTVQMLGRLGYGPKVPHSPRWPIEAKVQAT